MPILKRLQLQCQRDFFLCCIALMFTHLKFAFISSFMESLCNHISSFISVSVHSAVGCWDCALFLDGKPSSVLFDLGILYQWDVRKPLERRQKVTQCFSYFCNGLWKNKWKKIKHTRRVNAVIIADIFQNVQIFS